MRISGAPWQNPGTDLAARVFASLHPDHALLALKAKAALLRAQGRFDDATGIAALSR